MNPEEQAADVTVDVVSPSPKTQSRRVAGMVGATALLLFGVVAWALIGADKERSTLQPKVETTESSAPTTTALPATTEEQTTVASTTTTAPSTTLAPPPPTTARRKSKASGGVGKSPVNDPECASAPTSPLMPNLVGLTEAQALYSFRPLEVYEYCTGAPIFTFIFNQVDTRCNAGPARGAVIVSQGVPAGTVLQWDPAVQMAGGIRLDLSYDLPC